MRKILLIQHHNFLNGSGGTEKICCFLANNFCKNNFEVEIATNQEIEGKAIFYLKKSVKVINIFDEKIIQKKTLNVFNYKGKNLFLWIFYKVKKKYVKLYNKFLLKEHNGLEGVYKFNLEQRAKSWKRFINESKPDVIITMSIGSLLEITYKNNYDIPIINSVHGRPDYDFTDLLWYRSKIEMELLLESYKKLSAIQVLFESYKEFLPETFNGVAVHIPNPVLQIDEYEVVNHVSGKDNYIIINIASLNTSCKQQHVAISIFSKIADKNPDWNMVFWGVGNDLDMLQKQVKELKLEDRILFKGFTNEPLEQLKKSDIFIFPSKYEGFPLALSEAMSVGLPCIGFLSCSGVNQLIKNKENGFLARDDNEMQFYLQELINNSKLRKNIGRSAYRSIEQYSEANVFNKWLDLISQYQKRI